MTVMIKKDKKIAVYTDLFLTPSMTFIFRQLNAVSKSWQTFAIARSKANTNLFSYSDVYCSKRTIFERIINKFLRIFGIRYIALRKASLKYFKSVLLKEKPSLIHAHFGPSALEILPLAKSLNIPLITTFHGFDASLLLKNSTYVKQLRELFDYSYILAVSEKMKLDLVQLGANDDRSKCAYIGVPLENFNFTQRTTLYEKFLRKDEISFLQVSNFVEKKGHKYTILAFSKLLEIYPNARLMLAGDGYLRDEMENYVLELGIEYAIQFVGHKNSTEVSKLMSKVDCFLHHSVTASDGDQEGIPTVIMEAMATGLPVISTNHAGIPELITNNQNGYLVNERDISAYVEAMIKVLEEKGSMGISARKTIEKKFNMKIQIESLLDIYEGIVLENKKNI
jgi:glycosyltransferase involved in cell wall biosynthesis